MLSVVDVCCVSRLPNLAARQADGCRSTPAAPHAVDRQIGWVSACLMASAETEETVMSNTPLFRRALLICGGDLSGLPRRGRRRAALRAICHWPRLNSSARGQGLRRKMEPDRQELAYGDQVALDSGAGGLALGFAVAVMLVVSGWPAGSARPLSRRCSCRSLGSSPD